MITPPVDAREAAEIRRRLPHVPAAFSTTVRANDIDPHALTQPGMPRPKYRQVPIPATARVEHGELNIIQSDAQDWRETIRQRLCDLCAEPLSSEDRVYMTAEIDPRDSRWGLVRGGMHRRCFQVTCHWCPHIRERLLDGTMLACSLAYDDTSNPAVFEILDEDTDQVTADGNVISEYRVELSVVRAEWPFKRRAVPAA